MNNICSVDVNCISKKQRYILYLMMCASQKRGCIDYSVPEMAERYGCSVRTIQRILSFLRKCDLIEEVQTKTKEVLRRIKNEVKTFLKNPYKWLGSHLKISFFQQENGIENGMEIGTHHDRDSDAHFPKKDELPISYKERVREKDKECTVQDSEEIDMAEAIADGIVNHPLFVPIKTKEAAYTYFRDRPKQALENLEYLENELAKLKFRHVKTGISNFLSKINHKLGMYLDSTPRTLTFGNDPKELQTGLDAYDWKEFLKNIIAFVGFDYSFDKEISDLEQQIDIAVESDVQRWKKNANKQSKR